MVPASPTRFHSGETVQKLSLDKGAGLNRSRAFHVFVIFINAAIRFFS
jgi:hypothetical protein